jgi:hypothetical protein
VIGERRGGNGERKKGGRWEKWDGSGEKEMGGGMEGWDWRKTKGMDSSSVTLRLNLGDGRWARVAGGGRVNGWKCEKRGWEISLVKGCGIDGKIASSLEERQFKVRR